MPKYEVEVPHNLPLPEVRTRLDQAKGKLESDYGATCTWKADDQLEVSRKGLQALVHLEPSRLKVDLDLGFLLTPMAGSIRNGITKQLTDLLSKPA